MEDELMQDPGMELDPMPGDDEAQVPAEAMPDQAEPAPDAGLTPEDRRRLAESLILEDPDLKETYLRGLAASQAPQQAPEPEPEDQFQQLIGDPALEFLGKKIQALEQRIVQEQAEKQAMRVTQQFIAQTEADPEIAQQLQAINGMGLLLEQVPGLAPLMTDLVKRAGSAKKHDQAVAGSIKPPTVVGQGTAQAGDLGVTGKAQMLKKSLSGKDGYKNFTDKDWKELAAAEEGVK